MESSTDRVMSRVSPVGCRLSAPQLPRGGALPGAAQSRSSSSHMTPSHQGEQTAPCLAGWLPTLAS